MSKPTIRFATPEDFDEVLALLLKMHREIAIAPLNLEKASEEIKRLLAQGTVIVSEDTRIRGTIALDRNNWFYSDQWFLSDVWFYVDPKHRKGGHASRLIDAAIESKEALAQKLAERNLRLIIGVQSEVDPATKMKMLNRKMNLFGGMFIH